MSFSSVVVRTDSEVFNGNGFGGLGTSVYRGARRPLRADEELRAVKLPSGATTVVALAPNETARYRHKWTEVCNMLIVCESCGFLMVHAQNEVCEEFSFDFNADRVDILITAVPIRHSLYPLVPKS